MPQSDREEPATGPGYRFRDELYDRVDRYDKSALAVPAAVTPLVIDARYEEGVFVPTAPLDLAPSSDVQLTVRPSTALLVNPLTEAEHRTLVARFLSYAKDYSSVPRLTRDQLHDRD